MNRRLREHVNGFLRVAGAVEGHLLHLRNFSAREWETSLNWLHLSGIALLFWDRLQKLGAQSILPDQVGSSLAADLIEHRVRIASMKQEFASLNQQFEREGIECLVLKGFALVPDYCPDASLRPSYDYDFLVAGKDQIRAQALLQAAGYVRKPGRGPDHHVAFRPPTPPPRPRNSPRGYYAANYPRNVELHERLWDNEAFRVVLRVPENLFARKMRRESQGLGFCSLADEDALVFQSLHVFQHILHDWCRLGWLWEIAYFLENRARDTAFWIKFHAHLEGNKTLAEIVALVLTLSARLFHATLPAPVKEQIQTAMRGPVSLWLNHYGLRSALNNFSENKYALFLYREFVPDEATWRQIRSSRLLPLHRPNEVARVARPASGAVSPARFRQGWYVVQRLIHHVWGGAGYAWESAQWRRLRRLSATRAISSS